MKKENVLNLFVRHLKQQTPDKHNATTIEIQNYLFQLVDDDYLIQNENGNITGITWKGLELLDKLRTE